MEKRTSTPQHSCSFSDRSEGSSDPSQLPRKMHWLLWSTVKQTRQRLMSGFIRVNISPASICMGNDGTRGRRASTLSSVFSVVVSDGENAVVSRERSHELGEPQHNIVVEHPATLTATVAREQSASSRWLLASFVPGPGLDAASSAQPAVAHSN